MKNDHQEGEIQLISWVNEVPKFGITQAALLVIGELNLHIANGEQNEAFQKLGEFIVSLIDKNEHQSPEK